MVAQSLHDPAPFRRVTIPPLDLHVVCQLHALLGRNLSHVTLPKEEGFEDMQLNDGTIILTLIHAVQRFVRQLF